MDLAAPCLPNVEAETVVPAVLDAATTTLPETDSNENQEKGNELKEVVVKNDREVNRNRDPNTENNDILHQRRHIIASLTAFVLFCGSIFCTVHTFNHLIYEKANTIALTWAAVVFTGLFILLGMMCYDYSEDPEWYWAFVMFNLDELIEERKDIYNREIYQEAYYDIIQTLYENGEIELVEVTEQSYDDYLASLEKDEIQFDEIEGQIDNGIERQMDKRVNREESIEKDIIQDESISKELTKGDENREESRDGVAEVQESTHITSQDENLEYIPTNQVLMPEETDIAVKKNQ